MAERFRNALVVGKFSPLHLGHERLIRYASERSERLYLLSYSQPELPGCEAARRAIWLNTRFANIPHWLITPAQIDQWRDEGRVLPDLPNNDASDDQQRQFVADICCQILGATMDAVFTSEAYGDGFAAHLARCFGHPVRHVCVDQARLTVPISGTRLRENLHGLKDFLAPEVYADFVESILLLGGESTGKSALSIALAAALDTCHVAEFGREHWLAKSGLLEYDDLLYIGRIQVQRENELAAQARRYLVCDTSPLTTLFYSQAMFNRVEPELEALAGRRYRHIFLCADDFPFVQDGTRQASSFRQCQQSWYRVELARRGWSYKLLSGSIEQRVAQALAYLQATAASQSYWSPAL